MRNETNSHNDVASIVTTAVNNYDALGPPSRNLSQENSNETHSAGGDDGAISGSVLQTQHHFPNLIAYPYQHSRGGQSLYAQGTATESTLENRRNANGSGIRSFAVEDGEQDRGSNSPRIITNHFQNASTSIPHSVMSI